VIPDIWPDSIRGINQLPTDQKHALYSTLIPDWIFQDYEIDPVTHEHRGQDAVRFVCHKGTRVLELFVQRTPYDSDPVMYLNMADTFNQQILVLLVVVNDPTAPRFDTDRDANGNLTQFGTVSRNIPAELAAMQEGLAPGQVRRGVRAFRRAIPVFEQFVSRMGHALFLIEPLAYHNAITFERYGFNYLRGLKTMQEIHVEFQEGGDAARRLNGSTPFRLPEAALTVRGRSWAIHDGVLGYPFTGFQMYKRIGHHADINTSSDLQW
jgi:hypothetical protein